MARLKSIGGRFDLCIGLLEYRSIARGIESTDAMLKVAPITLLISQPISPGKYISLIHGEVEEVASALERGVAVGGDDVVDRLYLPNPHPEIATTLERGSDLIDPGPVAALGVVETLSVASTLVCSDIAVKHSAVRLLRMGLGIGIGGKAFVTLTGDEEDVLEATTVAAEYASKNGKLLRTVVIPQLHEGMTGYL